MLSPFSAEPWYALGWLSGVHTAANPAYCFIYPRAWGTDGRKISKIIWTNSRYNVSLLCEKGGRFDRKRETVRTGSDRSGNICRCVIGRCASRWPLFVSFAQPIANASDASFVLLCSANELFDSHLD